MVSLLSLPYEDRYKILFYTLLPFPQHLQLRNESQYLYSTIQSSRHNDTVYLPSIFLANKQMYKECRDIHFKFTPLPIRFKAQMVVFQSVAPDSMEFEHPNSRNRFNKYIDTLFEESNRIRMIDINLCTFPLDIDPQGFRSFLKKVKRSLPKLKSIHVTIDITARGVRHITTGG